MYLRQLAFMFFLLVLIVSNPLLVKSQEFAAQESPRIVESVNVKGNQRTLDKDILFYVQTRAQQPFSREQANLDLQSILAIGFFDPKGTRVLFENGMQGGVSVVFEVAELPIIHTLKYEGLQSITEQELRKALRAKKISIAQGGVAHPEKLNLAVSLIKELLAERGMSKATVELQEKLESPTAVTIRFVITERP